MLDPVLNRARRQTRPSAAWMHGHEPVRVAEGDKPKLGGRVDDEVLRHSADVGHSQAGPHQELDDEVTVTNAPKTVLRDGVEAQLLREELAVDAEGVASEGTGAEGKNSNTRNELLQALEIGCEGERVREEKMGPSDGLASLVWNLTRVMRNTSG